MYLDRSAAAMRICSARASERCCIRLVADRGDAVVVAALSSGVGFLIAIDAIIVRTARGHPIAWGRSHRASQQVL